MPMHAWYTDRAQIVGELDPKNRPVVDHAILCCGLITVRVSLNPRAQPQGAIYWVGLSYQGGASDQSQDQEVHA